MIALNSPRRPTTTATTVSAVSATGDDHDSDDGDDSDHNDRERGGQFVGGGTYFPELDVTICPGDVYEGDGGDDDEGDVM